MNLKQWIRDVSDYPKPGILFRDITPLLAHPPAFSYAIDRMSEPFQGAPLDAIGAIDARGFLIGAPMASALGLPLIPLRKANKLPGHTIGENFNLEYGAGRIEVHIDALRPAQRVVIVDDLLATGGTARAASSVVSRLGARVDAFAFLIELTDLGGRNALTGPEIHSVIQY